MPEITKRAVHRLSLTNPRENYGPGGLDEADCDSNPIVQFERWFGEAQTSACKEVNAMTLATATADGKPSARVVLLKEVSELGFVFYTNYGSRKAQELKTNPFAALTFYWGELARQVRLEGSVEMVSRDESADYFRTRPRGSQLGAWVSHQSNTVNSRADIEMRLAELDGLYAGREVPAPEFWGGFRLSPATFEFWQGRPNRLHDRLLYRRKGENEWGIERLWP